MTGRIFFQSDRAGGMELFSMNPDGSRLARLTHDGANTHPAVSPDGTRLAYIHGGDVWTMDIDGTGKRRITDTAEVEQTPDWSPDGTRLVYSARGVGADQEIMVRAADGSGAATQLTDNTFPDTDPTWSEPLGGAPQGLIAFVSARTGDTDRNIYVMSPTGGAVKNLTPYGQYAGLPYQGHDDSPSWTPDGRIAYTHTFLPNAGGLPAVWTIKPDGSAMTRVSTDSSRSATDPVFSPDGTKIAYIGTAGTDRNVAVMSSNGSGGSFVDTATSHDIEPDWQEDSTAPETTLSGAPSGETTATGVSITVASNEPGSTLECSLDGAAFMPCSSPVVHTSLGLGAHQFRARAIDPVGRVDLTPVTAAWTVVSPPPPATATPTTPPTATPTTGPTATTTTTTTTAAQMSTVTKAVLTKVPTTTRGGRLKVQVTGAASLGSIDGIDGKAKVLLRAVTGSKKISSTATITGGTAAVRLPKLPRGAYKVTVRFLGSEGIEGSRAVEKFRVRR
ncbi:hypothetical protein G7071_08965 [Nocardioides piscis]|uniref:Bacterial Ig-like domain-containing protein n=1 Tax=Nocardioides piscis TaxID=2714938 RepID=A0A6G7YFP3_9ACTN|nr:hypothetical protein G7071_08965 [Nocardioides piscis]